MYRTTRLAVIALAALVSFQAQPVARQTAARSVTEVRQLYDADKYRDVVGAANQASLDSDQAARLQYLVAQSDDKLKDTEATKSAYQRLAAKGDPVGPDRQSGLAVDGQETGRGARVGE
jgi:hypothetical protein